MTRLGMIFCLLSFSALSKITAPVIEPMALTSAGVLQNDSPMDCAALMEVPDSKELARRLYEKAFVLSFESNLLAKKYSECSSMIINGTKNWPFETWSFVH